MCCLFGLMDYRGTLSVKQKNQIVSALASAAEARGTDATGIAYNSGGRLRIFKQPIPGHKMRFHIPQDASAILGHTRMTTQGAASRNRNNHPFGGQVDGENFALTHNGVLFNDTILRRELRLPKTNIETDSYIGVQLIEQKGTLDFSSLAYMAEQVEGSFSFAVLDGQNNVYLVKGENPICLYHYPARRIYLYASTEAVLKQALQRLRFSLGNPEDIPLDCGEILKISADGTTERSRFDDTKILRNWSPFPWRNILRPGRQPDHVRELKDIAPAFGYQPEDVDELLGYGLSPWEIEDYFYDCQEVPGCVF